MRRGRLFAASLVALLAGGGGALACGMPSSFPVLQITVVEATILESDPLQLTLTLKAEAPTPGYSEPWLEPVYYVEPPTDGIYDVYVVAEGPMDFAPEVVTPIEATVALPYEPGTIAGYRLHAAGNCVTLLLDDQAATPQDGCELQRGPNLAL